MATRALLNILLFGFLFGAASLFAQREKVIQPPDETQYGRRFFVQLRGVFGRFRDSDLQRTFEKAQPIQCSELINDKGEWRTVAFFNEKRELGDWFRSSFEEVKSDLSVFTFKGFCRGEHGSVQLVTRFPVTESINAFNRGTLGLEDVEVNVNAPVSAQFDSQTLAYTFDLPYLFLVSSQDDESIYSLDPPRLLDRDKYATDVTNHWDCKSVTADAVTYRFMICRTTTVSRSSGARNQNRPAFGSSAYFILSDGKEAAASVNLTFNDVNDAKHTVEDASVPDAPDVSGPVSWTAPEDDETILGVLRGEFRLRFSEQSWTRKIAAAQVLYGQRLLSLQSTSPASGQDYCVWLPGDTGSVGRLLAQDSDEAVSYYVTAHDRDAQSATSILFDLRTPAELRLGTLQCFFPRTTSAAGIDFSRWKSIVGQHVMLEIQP